MIEFKRVSKNEKGAFAKQAYVLCDLKCFFKDDEVD